MKKEETKTAKTPKPVKVPGAFRKPIIKKTFINKFEKLIEHPQDKKFFTSCFVEKDDYFNIREGLTKDDAKRLKGLLKVIKENRKGAVNFLPLALVGIITAAIIIFFTIFANPLLGSAMEKGLEAIFEAKADVRGFRLSLIKFEISVRSITVANRDSPMTNLFDMGRVAIILRPQAVLRGKIYIEEISAAQIQFGTPRTFSGALPARPAKQKPEKPPKPDAPPLIDLQNFDAMALVNQEFDKLNTPRLYDQAINTYNETSAKWQQQVEGTSARVTELRSSTAPLLNINVSSMRDPETIRNTIQDINNAVNNVQAVTNDVTTIVGGLESDINTARRLETNARNALTDDINHLRSYIDLGSGAAFDTLEPFIRDMLSDTAEQYFDYGLMALEVLEKMRADAASKPKTEKPVKEKKVVFKGRDVQFPTVAYPTFYLGKLASDFTIPGDSWKWAFDLRNISSNPNFTRHNNFADGPVTLMLGVNEESGSLQRSVVFNGSADFRSDPNEKFKAVVDGKGFPVSLGNQLSAIGINGFSGESDFSLNMTGKNDGGISAGGNVFINKAQIIDPKGTLAEAVGTAVQEASSVNLGIQYADDKLNLTTNIADLIAQALRRTAEVYARKAMADIEAALRQKVDQYIDGRFASKEQVDALLRTARGDRTAIDQTKNALDAKKNEFEQRLRSIAGEAAQQAGQQAGQAVRDALPLPSLPGRR